MSDKISYILEVLDGYSKNTRKLKKELGTLESSLSSLDKKLNSTLVKFTKFEKLNFASTASQFEKMAKSMDKVSVATARAKKASTGFILVGSGSQITAVSAAEIRRQRSLKNAVVPFSNPFIMTGGGKGSRSYSPRGYKPNFNIPIDSTYRRDAAGTGIVPYSRGGAVMSYGQRPMIDVTGTGRTINQDPIYNSPSQPSQPQQPPKRPSFFGGGEGVSIANVAKGMGYYRAIDMAVSAPSKIHDVTVEMDALRAGLSALIPTVKGMENATAQSEVAYLRSVSDKYGFAFSDVAPSYLKLLGTGGKIDASLAKGILENVGGYGGLIGMSGPALEGTMRGFQDMLSKQVLNAQEVNLQMQQMPGAKPMLHKAFKRFAEKKGMKGLTDENVSARFTKAMATGKLPSADILREFVQVLNEMFGEQMLQKAYKLGNEEKRLQNAFQQLGDEIGLLTYDTQIGAVRGLAEITKGVNTSLSEVTKSFGILDEAMKDSKLYKIVKGMAGGLLDVVTEGTAELVKAPFKLANAGGGLIAARITGDDEGRKEIKRDLRNYYFGNQNQSNGQNSLGSEPQKIEITIKSGSDIKVQDVKSNRPSTVKAGQR
jgi:tape measure domain-containing protein